MASTGEPWRLGLDRLGLHGLRGIAILLVLVDHSRLTSPGVGVSVGAAGVTVFFTLSGFLITALLLEERARNGRVSFGGFYLRRARRLFPALAVFLAAMVVCSVVFNPVFMPSGSELGAAVFYVSNWWTVLHPQISSTGSGIGQTWSLGIEEQFYLLWPLLLVFVLRRFGRTGAVAVTLVGIVAANFERVALWHDGAGLIRVYHGTDTHADALLVGCLLALLLHGSRARVTGSPRVAAVAGVVLVAASLVPNVPWAFLVVPLLIPVLTAVVIWATVSIAVGGAGPWWLTNRPLVLLGRVSYGLYLWHFPLLWIAAVMLPLPHVLAFVLCLAASLVLTVASWRWVEQPFLKLNHRGEPRSAVVLDQPHARRFGVVTTGEEVVDPVIVHAP